VHPRVRNRKVLSRARSREPRAASRERTLLVGSARYCVMKPSTSTLPDATFMVST
jgi:hypothetical protein